MSGDMFVNNNENPFGSKLQDEDNFFLQPEDIHSYAKQTEPQRRLNDYDYNILKEDAYKDVTDEIFKLEYKISKTEEELKDIDNKIRMAKDVRDFNKVEQLFNRKKQLQEDLDGLIEIYNDTSLSAKISGGITNLLSPKVKEQFGGIRKLFGMFSDAIIAKLPKKFSSVLELRKSLAKLENINKSVDELMTMQTPYGEAGDKYIKLSKYITRANTIQAEIGEFTKF